MQLTRLVGHVRGGHGVAPALRGSRHMISVVLGAERVTLEDGVTIQTRSFSETSRMFDWGFDNFVLRDILSSSDLVQEVPVALSSEASYVSTHAAEDISCLLPDGGRARRRGRRARQADALLQW